MSLAQDGEGLGAMWGEVKTREYLQKAGFRNIQTNLLAHDIQNNWYGDAPLGIPERSS